VGAVGGAGRSGTFRGLDPETTRSAMAIAANYAQHTRFEAATEGATVRNVYAGMSNLAALVAVDQAEAGFGGFENGVARHLESAADGVDEAALSAGLGERWELEHGYFKIHAACRYTHPTLDAIAALPDGLDAAAVESVPRRDVSGGRTADGVATAKPTAGEVLDPVRGRDGALLRGETGPTAFVDEAITSEAIALAERVTVAVDDGSPPGLPEQRGARVIVETANERFARGRRPARRRARPVRRGAARIEVPSWSRP